MLFQWAQLEHSITTRWKILFSNYSVIDEENFCQNHHVVKGARIFST